MDAEKKEFERKKKAKVAMWVSFISCRIHLLATVGTYAKTMFMMPLTFWVMGYETKLSVMTG